LPKPEAIETVRDMRRAQIVRAARTIVAEEGLEALTFAALEKRLAFTRGVVTYHFKDKSEIVGAVLASAIDEIDASVKAAISSADDIGGKVAAILRANVRGFTEQKEAGRVLFSFWSRLAADDSARRLNAALHARYRAQTETLLEKARAAGRIDADVDPGGLATTLVALVIGLTTQHYFDAKAIDLDAAIDEATRSVLARLRPRPARSARASQRAT
jgi:TetR/AcrR family transcriptional regulator, cholesterol catabolism regulator